MPKKSSPRQTIPSRRLGGRTADNTNRLFAATLEILKSDGMTGVTFAAVGEAAGVNRSTLYRRWPSAADLVSEAVAARVAVQVPVADTGSLAGDMRATLISLARFMESPVGRASLAASAALAGNPKAGNSVQDMWAKRLDVLQPIFTRARTRGEISDEFDSEAFIATLSGALLFRILVAARPLDTLWIDRAINIVLGKEA